MSEERGAAQDPTREEAAVVLRKARRELGEHFTATQYGEWSERENRLLRLRQVPWSRVRQAAGLTGLKGGEMLAARQFDERQPGGQQPDVRQQPERRRHPDRRHRGDHRPKGGK